MLLLIDTLSSLLETSKMNKILIILHKISPGRKNEKYKFWLLNPSKFVKYPKIFCNIMIHELRQILINLNFCDLINIFMINIFCVRFWWYMILQITNTDILNPLITDFKIKWMKLYFCMSQEYKKYINYCICIKNLGKIELNKCHIQDKFEILLFILS